MAVHLIPPDHPYIAQLKPSTFATHDGKWRVKWRCFASLKQDIDFATESEARRFARRIMLGPHKWDDENGMGASYAECDRFWRELAKK